MIPIWGLSPNNHSIDQDLTAIVEEIAVIMKISSHITPTATDVYGKPEKPEINLHHDEVKLREAIRGMEDLELLIEQGDFSDEPGPLISETLIGIGRGEVHTTNAGALCFESLLGETHPTQPEALAALFEQFADQVSCVVLNACYSETQAKAIAKHIDHIIGISQAIGNRAAIAFIIGFYQAIGAGRTIEEAYKLGCMQIQLQNIPEHLTPILIKKE